MLNKRKTPVYRRGFVAAIGRKQKTSRKKLIGIGLGSAVIAVIAGAFVKDKESYE